MDQVSNRTIEKRRLEDTICRLKSEAMASVSSFNETLEQLEKEKQITVSHVTCHVMSCDVSCDVTL